MNDLFEWIGDKYSKDTDSLTANQKKTEDRKICCEWYLDNADDNTDNILEALLLH